MAQNNTTPAMTPEKLAVSGLTPVADSWFTVCMATNTTPARYATEILHTDQIAYEVVAITAATIKVRAMTPGADIAAENRDGNPYPIITRAALPDPDAPVRTLRIRKDGTYRMCDGARPLRFTDNPTFVTDYRY